jgi:hypothetical protein
MNNGEDVGCFILVILAAVAVIGIAVKGGCTPHKGKSVGFEPEAVKPGSRPKTVERRMEQRKAEKQAQTQKPKPDPEPKPKPKADPPPKEDPEEPKRKKRKIGEMREVEVPKREVELPDLW